MIEEKKRSNTRSVMVLLVLTNILFPFMVGMGYIITKILKKPAASLDDYGWRGVGFSSISLAIVLAYVTCLMMVRGTDAILGIVSFSILFFAISLLTGKKLITDWT